MLLLVTNSEVLVANSEVLVANTEKNLVGSMEFCLEFYYQVTTHRKIYIEGVVLGGRGGGER